MKRTSAAYTIIEVLVAAAILMVAVCAAAAIALATVTQEEINARAARCLNLHEQAVRLYQLGLDPAIASAILPPDSSVVSLAFTTQNLPIANLGTVERTECVLTFEASPSEAGGETRSNTLIGIRPSIR